MIQFDCCKIFAVFYVTFYLTVRDGVSNDWDFHSFSSTKNFPIGTLLSVLGNLNLTKKYEISVSSKLYFYTKMVWFLLIVALLFQIFLNSGQVKYFCLDDVMLMIKCKSPFGVMSPNKFAYQLIKRSPFVDDIMDTIHLCNEKKFFNIIFCLSI